MQIKWKEWENLYHNEVTSRDPITKYNYVIETFNKDEN